MVHPILQSSAKTENFERFFVNKPQTAPISRETSKAPADQDRPVISGVFSAKRPFPAAGLMSMSSFLGALWVLQA
jgi:hypothetical protein